MKNFIWIFVLVLYFHVEAEKLTCPSNTYCQSLGRKPCENPPFCGSCLNGLIQNSKDECVYSQSYLAQDLDDVIVDKYASKLDAVTTSSKNNIKERQVGSSENSSQNKSSDSYETKVTSSNLENANFATNVFFVGIVSITSAAAFIGFILALYCWCRANRMKKLVENTPYPAYGVTGPSVERVIRRGPGSNLARSAQMYHYQHQKEQMIAMEQAKSTGSKSGSESGTDDDSDTGKVYHCPGLASGGQMEVTNPLYIGDEESEYSSSERTKKSNISRRNQSNASTHSSHSNGTEGNRDSDNLSRSSSRGRKNRQKKLDLSNNNQDMQ